ncbi:ClpP-like prohead protease/major capsid protein fusion protein [Malikia granosa]|uniref:ATP-dependent Clp protease proteolytic subunit n=1 Tax=Malikia granosa TaxID=263067 RepID=A0A2S9K2W4_9BURK|nr:ClpP-like prohead protease/major capsid protein fusion protein [Malikia granosa]PRD64806.1 peptidase S14 [Malikia granosa]
MTSQNKWYEIKAMAQQGDGAPVVAEIYVYGNIGDRWNEDGVIASEMVRDIAALEADEITLRINSYGGSVTDGLAIYNALKRHPAPVHVQVDGVAISCASYLAMAGDTVTMARNAQMMIHAPWSFAGGNSADLREMADILDRYAKSMASAYADKSGKTYEQALAILTDGKDHWFSADEAVAEGFADAIGAEVDAAAALAVNSFDLSRFRPSASAAPAAVPAATPVSQPPAAVGNIQEHSMPDPVNAAAQPAAPAAPFARTKEMNLQVLASFKPFEAKPGVQALKDEVLADPSLTLEQIQSRLLVEIGKDNAPANPQGAHPNVQTVADEADKQRAAISAALLARAGVEQDAKARAALSANPFRGHKLLDVARASLARAGRSTDGMDQMQIVAAAFTQGTSDFPILLETTMHKALQAAYATAALTWQRFCATGTVSDFRAHNRYRLGSFGNLDAVNELGEYINKSIPDGEKASIQAATKGNIINISRQAIINDDLGAFVGLSAMLGRAAARTVESDVYALLALNNGLGPTMADGYALFSANHGNISTAAALSMAAIDADRVTMALQKDVSGNDYLDLRPAVLLVPLGLGGTARTINGALYDPDTANKLQRPNMVNGLFRDIVDTPRLSGTRRYVFADAMEAPVLEVAFLDGAQTPYLELQNGFDVDGGRYKVRLDYGVAAVDYRGAVTNAGA